MMFPFLIGKVLTVLATLALAVTLVTVSIPYR